MLELVSPQPAPPPRAFHGTGRSPAVIHRDHDGVRLRIRIPGDLTTLEFAPVRRVPPGPGQISVAVSAASVSYPDVLIALGRYPNLEGREPQLGFDFAGVVTAVGQDVTTHRVGDQVAGMSLEGCWGTLLTCDAHLALTLPPGLAADQAAAVTTASALAWHSLHQLARIQPGERVLIHSATGGVGQAALAIARAAGAEIFVTAGSPHRRKLLRDMGVEHVYDSRGTEFADLIRRETHGYGLDIVLNSLTGEAQSAGLELLAFGGRFVELGTHHLKADVLGLLPFRRNLAFYGVDLRAMSASRPDDVCDLLDTVYWLTANGVLPLPEITHYPLAEAATAVEAMHTGWHTGKLVLDVSEAGL